MNKFITYQGVVSGSEKSIPLYCDNNRTIAQVKEPKSHQKSKYVLKRFHLIIEIMACGDVVMERVSSKDNITDPLTKSLSHYYL